MHHQSLRASRLALLRCSPGHRLWVRCSSSRSLSPPTIAALLRQSPPSLSSQQPPSSGGTLTLNGFVRSLRKQKRVAFAAVGDGSSLQTVQAVLTPEQAEGSVAVAPFPSRLRCRYILTDRAAQLVDGDSRGGDGPMDAVTGKWSIPRVAGRRRPHLGRQRCCGECDALHHVAKGMPG